MRARRSAGELSLIIPSDPKDEGRTPSFVIRHS
jgi:hypothetical protein